MTAIELLKVNETTLHVMLANGITPSDVRYIPLFETYQQMAAAGDKRTYIKAVLAERYGIKLRAVDYILRRMRRMVKI